MAKQLEGVYENVIACAKVEFLEKGYGEASLRIIAAKAGTSTGSIYTRFQSKEGLFAAIVSPVIEELEKWFLKEQEEFSKAPSQEQEKAVRSYSKQGMEEMTNYIYDHEKEFRLLLECSEGTEFSDFIDRMVKTEVEYTYHFLDAIGKTNTDGTTETLLHIVFSAYYSGVFEMIRHNMPKEEGTIYVNKLREFYYAGFNKLFM